MQIRIKLQSGNVDIEFHELPELRDLINKELATMLKKFRARNFLTQAELGLLMKVQLGTISNWETGKSTMGMDSIERFHHLLHHTSNQIHVKLTSIKDGKAGFVGSA